MASRGRPSDIRVKQGNYANSRTKPTALKPRFDNVLQYNDLRFLADVVLGPADVACEPGVLFSEPVPHPTVGLAWHASDLYVWVELQAAELRVCLTPLLLLQLAASDLEKLVHEVLLRTDEVLGEHGVEVLATQGKAGQDNF